jgi:hypothetical protein
MRDPHRSSRHPGCGLLIAVPSYLQRESSRLRPWSLRSFAVFERVLNLGVQVENRQLQQADCLL